MGVEGIDKVECWFMKWGYGGRGMFLSVAAGYGNLPLIHLEFEELEVHRQELDKQEVEQPEVGRFDLDEPGVGKLELD
ncbi:hypothetical protein Tco_0858629 [Tanacetum coccineum]|uniref:Uncharacterized protein n=1 Tax=Tanacetum coccineum TaxID=301880 RepID=A0ABQ5BCM4_9ASTR